MLLKEKKNNNKDLERYLARLEREAGDDLVMLLEYGPDCFETFELDMLLERVKEQGRQLLLLKRTAALVFAISLLSVAISIYAFLSEQLFFGYLFLGFLPVYLGLGAYMFYRFYKNHLTINKTAYLKNLLEKEIYIRRNKAFF